MRGGPPAMVRIGRLAVAGFSLVELLIVIAILSIVMATAVGSFDNISRFFTRENVKSETQKKTRFGLETMIQDIMLAGLNPRGVSGSGVQMATGTSIRVASDLNFDGDFDDPSETVTYALNGTNLQQTNHLGTETLVENVSSFRLVYFNAGGAELAEPINIADVRSVGLSIAITKPAGRAKSVTRAYSVHIRCRNL
jgi:prepilin-type N-terminal cleavage/methylation domain-containing protein